MPRSWCLVSLGKKWCHELDQVELWHSGNARKDLWWFPVDPPSSLFDHLISLASSEEKHQSGLAGRWEQGQSFDRLILLRTKLVAQAGLQEEARNTNQTRAYSAELPGWAVFTQVWQPHPVNELFLLKAEERSHPSQILQIHVQNRIELVFLSECILLRMLFKWLPTYQKAFS